MQDLSIQDSQITTSSALPGGCLGRTARLNLVYGGGAGWCALHNNVEQWLQVDFKVLVVVTGIQTQDRKNKAQWVKSYKISYSFDGTKFITLDTVSGKCCSMKFT